MTNTNEEIEYLHDSEDVFDIREELKKLPSKPGVYIMHGPKDEIIYVGKAVNLKNRVRQYFQSDKNKTDKIKKMISLIRRFEYIVVDSEMEALVLENNLIKENSPKYNTLLKDDKTYPYIKVTSDEHFPRVYMTRKVTKDKSRYFGPYTSGLAVRDTIDLIHKLFRIRSCSRRLPEDIGKERPCLYYHLGQCLGPCNAYVDENAYRRHIDRALEFLSGKYDYVKNYLTDKMMKASDAMEFEQAIEYRELIAEIDSLAASQKVSMVDSDDRDIIGIGILGNDAVAQCFFLRDGRMIGREYVHLEVDGKKDISEIVSDFIGQYYSGTPYIPREIWVQAEVSDKTLLEDWLSAERNAKDHSKVRIVTPKRGDKSKLVEMAVKNADNQILKDFEKLKREDKRTKGAQEEIRSILGIEELHRIESYDISNISGFNSVGSMVVFVDGKPKNSDYRKFKIKTVQGPNDYASMREVLMRRFKRGLDGQESGVDAAQNPSDGSVSLSDGSVSLSDGSDSLSDGLDSLVEVKRETDRSKMIKGDSFAHLPDLIMMDGGRGQVNIAEEVLEELGLDIPVSGMVKDDGHRTRGLYFRNQELPIDTHSEAFKLITRVQDETHRFAIEYHKSLRSKAQIHSILDDVPGIGPVRRKALMKYFGNIELIKNASVEELAEVPEMNAEAAGNVYRFFHT